MSVEITLSVRISPFYSIFSFRFFRYGVELRLFNWSSLTTARGVLLCLVGLIEPLLLVVGVVFLVMTPFLAMSEPRWLGCFRPLLMSLRFACEVRLSLCRLGSAALPLPTPIIELY